MIEKEYSSILKLSDEKRQYESPIIVPKNRAIKEYYKYDKSTDARSKKHNKVSEERYVNPEMSIELDKIKQQIASQYNKLNNTK